MHEILGLSPDTLVLVAGLAGVAIAQYLGARRRLRSEAMDLLTAERNAYRDRAARLQEELAAKEIEVQSLRQTNKVLEGILKGVAAQGGSPA